MKLVLLLADAVQTETSGKTHALGIGWTAIDAPTTQPMALLALVYFDGPAEAIEPRDIELRLVEDDGTPVTLAETGGSIVILGRIGLDPEAGTPENSPVLVPFSLNIGPGLPLAPDRKYRWEAELDGEVDSVAFLTRPPSPGAPPLIKVPRGEKQAGS